MNNDNVIEFLGDKGVSGLNSLCGDFGVDEYLTDDFQDFYFNAMNESDLVGFSDKIVLGDVNNGLEWIGYDSQGNFKTYDSCNAERLLYDALVSEIENRLFDDVHTIMLKGYYGEEYEIFISEFVEV